MKNAEGYPDPTAGDAIRACGRMPTHIYNVYSVINNMAGLHGLEITGLRDKKTGKRMEERAIAYRRGRSPPETVHSKIQKRRKEWEHFLSF